MSKDRVKNSIWFVLFEGIRIYFSNVDKFFIYMLFPVLGQLAGIVLTFALTLGFAGRAAEKTESVSSLLLIVFLLALPGLLIFLKAFWDYMVAYVALNSMTEGALTTGKVYDFQSHREVATRRGGRYLGLLIAAGFLSVAAVVCCVIPVFGLIPPLILWIYFILIFQVFTFEEDISAADCFRKSMNLIKGDWARTFLLMLLLWFFSIFIITEGVTVIFDYLHLTDSVCSLFDFIGEALPLYTINRILTHLNIEEITTAMISKSVFCAILGVVAAEFTLPVRSICWTLWYKNLNALKFSGASQPVKKYKKKKSTEEE